jgi:hypothetical protein
MDVETVVRAGRQLFRAGTYLSLLGLRPSSREVSACA